MHIRVHLLRGGFVRCRAHPCALFAWRRAHFAVRFLGAKFLSCFLRIWFYRLSIRVGFSRYGNRTPAVVHIRVHLLRGGFVRCRAHPCALFAWRRAHFAVRFLGAKFLSCFLRIWFYRLSIWVGFSRYGNRTPTVVHIVCTPSGASPFAVGHIHVPFSPVGALTSRFDSFC